MPIQSLRKVFNSFPNSASVVLITKWNCEIVTFSKYHRVCINESKFQGPDYEGNLHLDWDCLLVCCRFDAFRGEHVRDDEAEHASGHAGGKSHLLANFLLHGVSLVHSLCICVASHWRIRISVSERVIGTQCVKIGSRVLWLTTG